MPKLRSLETIQRRRRMPKIEGLKDFPLGLLGLTPESIERSNGGVVIPLELIPFIKVCKASKVVRVQRATDKQKFVLRLRAEESRKHLERKRKSPRKGGKH